jgi:T-complex protein 1 subunit delta
MDKMITTSTGETIITNDGATILKQIELKHPAAMMMVDLSHSQDVEAGDGTTSVVVLAGSLLRAASGLLDKGIHPMTIADAYRKASEQSLVILKDIAVPAQLSDRKALINLAVTSLNSKIVSANSALLAPLAVDAVLKTIDVKSSNNVDLKNIKIVKKLGATVEETELIEGIVFEHAAEHKAGGPSSCKGAKIALIQYCLSPPKPNMEHSVVIDDYQQIDRALREERAYILKAINPIVKSGCNVLLVQKSILRDAVSELAAHYLAKRNIMVVPEVEREDIEFIATTLGCIPIADSDNFDAKKMGYADLVEEVNTPVGKIVKVTGVKNPGRTVTILVRGSNWMMVDEAERSVHDALCVVRSLVKQKFMVPGGGAPETEVGLQLSKHADTVGGMAGFCMKAYARALEVIPYTLAENAGLSPMSVVTELRRRHAQGEKTAGVNLKKGKITDILEENVLQPLLVSTSALKLATECVTTILKVDEIVAIR